MSLFSGSISNMPCVLYRLEEISYPTNIKHRQIYYILGSLLLFIIYIAVVLWAKYNDIKNIAGVIKHISINNEL